MKGYIFFYFICDLYKKKKNNQTAMYKAFNICLSVFQEQATRRKWKNSFRLLNTFEHFNNACVLHRCGRSTGESNPHSKGVANTMQLELCEWGPLYF